MSQIPTIDQVRKLKREFVRTHGELLAALNSSPPRPRAADYLRSKRDVVFRAFKRALEKAEAEHSFLLRKGP